MDNFGLNLFYRPLGLMDQIFFCRPQWLIELLALGSVNFHLSIKVFLDVHKFVLLCQSVSFYQLVSMDRVFCFSMHTRMNFCKNLVRELFLPFQKTDFLKFKITVLIRQSGFSILYFIY